MAKLIITLAAIAFVGISVLPAGAQYHRPGANGVYATLKNATPIIKRVDCMGDTGGCGCSAGWVSKCAPACCGCRKCNSGEGIY